MATWQEIHAEIEEVFAQRGVVGSRLLQVIDAENAYRDYVLRKFKGHRLVFDAFQDLMIETCQLATSGPTPTGSQYFGPAVQSHFLNVRSFRAADRTFLGGYPLDGYALLRDLKDRAIFFAAVVSGVTDLSSLSGTVGLANSGSVSTEEISRSASAEERRVRRLMTGSESGLNPETIEGLHEWEKTFHLEVHGSRMTRALEADYSPEGRVFMSVAPVPNDMSISFFLNRSSEIAWMLLRTLPYLQRSPDGFGAGWSRKWHLLDQALSADNAALISPEKPVFAAVRSLVTEKFAFAPETTSYVDRRPIG